MLVLLLGKSLNDRVYSLLWNSRRLLLLDIISYTKVKLQLQTVKSLQPKNELTLQRNNFLTGSSISLCVWCISLCSSITPVKSRWDVAVSAKLIGEFCFENDMIPPTLEIVHFSVFILHDHHQTFRLLSQPTSTRPS